MSLKRFFNMAFSDIVTGVSESSERLKVCLPDAKIHSLLRPSPFTLSPLRGVDRFLIRSKMAFVLGLGVNDKEECGRGHSVACSNACEEIF